MVSENSFRLKGIVWEEETFSDLLRRVVALHRALTARRVAYHLGVTEKALRDLKKRSALAARIMADLKAEAVSVGEKPARFREYDYLYLCPDGEMGKIYRAASDERERLYWLRRNQKHQEKAEARKNKTNAKKRRHAEVQSCKRDGMTQRVTAGHLSMSLSTVKRYWPETLLRKSLPKKRGRPVLPVGERMARQLIRRYEAGEISAYQAAFLLECESLPVPEPLMELARREIYSRQ